MTAKFTSAVMAVLLLCGSSARACDICGCGIGGYYFGLMPQLNKNLFGIRYRETGFHTRAHALESASDERFQTAELSFRWYPARRLQLFGFLPYSFNARRLEGESTWEHQQGLGDVALLANYMLFSGSSGKEGASIHHLVQIGGGVKLPTGKYTPPSDATGDDISANFQLGSGSIDFLLSLEYIARLGQWGLHTEGGAKLNTTNREGYHFGNRLNGQLYGFYVWNIGAGRKTSLVPKAGLYAETSDIDHEHGRRRSQTGGQLLNGVVGMEAFFRHWSAGISYQAPLAQRLAGGHLVEQAGWMLSAAYTF